jgi:hypothetical protein
MWRIRHINWIKNMLMNAKVQRIFLSDLHGSEQLQVLIGENKILLKII